MIDDVPFYFLMSLIATSGLKAGWVSKHILSIYTTKIEMCKFSKVIALLSRLSCNFNEKIKTSPESTAADLQPDPTLHHRRLRRGPPRRQQGQEQKRADRAA